MYSESIRHHLTKRFNVAVFLLSNKSNCVVGTRKVAQEAIANCFTDVLTSFHVICDLLVKRYKAAFMKEKQQLRVFPPIDHK